MKPGTKRQTVWLQVNGEINTLQGHSREHGYHASKPSVVARREGCRQGEVPAERWRELFGDDCHYCERPDNWKLIIYGSELGAQYKRDPKAKKEPEPVNENARLWEKFATMKLTQNPASRTHCYY